MRKKEVPTYEDFYKQVITLNKTNEQLCKYYNVSESVIHTWKRHYKITKDIKLVIQSYEHKGLPKGNVPWNKGIHKATSSKCAKTYFTREQIMSKAEYYVPKLGKDQLVVSDPTEPRRAFKSKHNNKIYQHVRRIPYARYVLKQAGIEVPKGHIVYHIDGNMYNNDIGNLEVISRGELMKRNHISSLLKKGE